MKYIIGQICGIIGTIITIIMPQFSKKNQITICGMLVNLMSALNYWLIGATISAALLCVVAIVQSGVLLIHNKKETEVTTAESILFLLLYLGVGFWGMLTAPGFIWELSWHNVLELLPIIGAVMFMLSVFSKGEQRTRLFLCLNGAVWAIYTAIIRATTFFSCFAAMTSSIIALRKYRKPEKKDAED